MKSCPFCGGAGVERSFTEPFRDVSWSPGYAEAYISCPQCGARTRTCSVWCGPRDPTEADIKIALEQARELWDRRL